ncbi:PhzF family phenazine biosynthesis protein [Keratinibaculum paraultunense]|uniref:PhzF family phenazine biosynthesis protein n=1 Tax=Keratinibaculum paraultunense TaxID=1278232 RepID=A0A4R3KTC9_9FIRM|nr:PhzF family phenazine biosynthesis protein [Keratinibaculum paraultunense]QQY79750.1 PhzF family phenazine biosynthesis protein [Keratinibaculum paraultunense]TCS86941.1 PhzF family phenazine biosynthesis protein [Keratinibaculum paraultunense]
MKINVYQVDVFSSKPFGGNPAAVVLNAEDLSNEDMQNIAREMNLSETIFVNPINERNYEIRFFTPTEEVDLCGHGTIGTFYVLVLKDYIKPMNNGIKKVYQYTKAGKLSVDIYFHNGNIDNIFMEQAPPIDFGDVKHIGDLLKCFSIKIEDIGIDKEYVNPRIISTGLKDILLPINKKEVLDNLKVDFNRLEDFTNKLEVVGVHAFHLPNVNSGKVYTRNFAPAVGIKEEAATGTSNGALVYFLKSRKYIHGNEIISIQGETMGRPSFIHCQIFKDNENYRIKIGGKAIMVLEGTIYF